MQRISRTLCLTTLFFAAGAALFFTKAAVIPYKVAYPVLLLSLSLFYLRLKPLIPVGAALLLSAVGDAAGAGGMFIPQMLFFALAHGAYMCYFLPQAQLAPRPFVWPVLTALLLFLFVCIVPRAADPAERAGVAVYGLVIAGMLYSALQYRGAYAAWFRLAALLFVFSDSVIAWGRFVAPVPCRTCVVMITYYAAQYLFYLFAVRAAHVRNSGSGNSFS
ncbi:lysoplasmalogenase [Alistipes finegoldii]|uniref:lysoplasmalogenase n=1 Tax=Alistipes finegoldii TaxID=214856 RepID=UPI0025A3A2AE|nr:lysoplasmalogenase [Alistipes finegoldii]